MEAFPILLLPCRLDTRQTQGEALWCRIQCRSTSIYRRDTGHDGSVYRGACRLHRSRHRIRFYEELEDGSKEDGSVSSDGSERQQVDSDSDCFDPDKVNVGQSSSSRTVRATVQCIEQGRLVEKVFQLCIYFLTHTFHNQDELNSPVVHFCGVLGIDWNKRRFRGPGNYTSFLAALLWIARLLLLEYALPKTAYATLDWPGREYYEDFNWRLENIRRSYLLDGGLNPAGYMISLLAYGKYVAQQLGGTGVCIWDEDGGAVQIKNCRITMFGFQSLVKHVIKQAEDILQRDLLFGIGSLQVDLAGMKDNMSETQYGYSLIDNEANHIGGGIRYMLSISRMASPDKTLTIFTQRVQCTLWDLCVGFGEIFKSLVQRVGCQIWLQMGLL